MAKLCECGCGKPAPLATVTNRRRGVLKGKPLRFIRGHNMRGTKRPKVSARLRARHRYSPRLAEANPHWKGGRVVCASGVRVYAPHHPNARDGYVLEHRLVMERVLGRFLLSHELVRHRDGNKANNVPENLIFTNRRGLRLSQLAKGDA